MGSAPVAGAERILMARSSHPPRRPFRPARWLAPLLGLGSVAALARWGGLPREDGALVGLGAAALLAMLALTAGAAWALLRTPPGVPRPAAASRPGLRRALARGLLGGAAAVVIGAFWDAVWHARYGLPFGEDLLWPPHLLMYAGMLSVPAAGLAAAAELARRGTGPWRRRLRADPALGLLLLVGAYFLYAVPADPLWHLVYGPDISAWSLPHLMLAFDFVLIGIAAEALHRSTTPAAAWAGPLVRRGAAQAVPTVLALGLALVVAVLVLAVEYDAAAGGGGPGALLARRPAWLFPALAAALAAGFGTLALRASRRVGSATAVGLLALGVRAGAALAVPEADAFGGVFSLRSHLLLLPPLLALDVAAAAALARRGRPLGWRGAGLAASLGWALGTLPLLRALYAVPRLEPSDLPVTLLAGVLAALGAAWVGAQAGGRLARAAPADAAAAASTGWRAVLPAAAVAALAVVLIALVPPPA